MRHVECRTGKSGVVAALLPSFSFLTSSFFLLTSSFLVFPTSAAVRDDLWFFADFDRVAELGGHAFDEPLPNAADAPGRFGRGRAFLSAKKRVDNDFWTIRDRELIKSFPDERGTFSCWFRSPESCMSNATPVFCLGGFWRYNWRWTGGEFRTSEKRGGWVKVAGFRRSPDWRHFAASWNERRVVCYLDGKVAGELASPVRDSVGSISNAVLRIGTGGDGLPAANLVLDEIAIFRRDLSADEVRGLATATRGLLEGVPRVVTSPMLLPFFWRDDPSAALRTHLYGLGGGAYTAAGRVGEFAIGAVSVVGRDGEADVALPFPAGRFRAGKYPWRVEVREPGGAVVASSAGELEMRPRLGRDRFHFLNWGGSKSASAGYLHEIGVTKMQCGGVPAARGAIRNGFLVNLRLDNYKSAAVKAFDASAIVREARARLRDLAGCHAWDSTLVNTEMYYGKHWLDVGTNSPVWSAFARRELGGDGSWRVTFTPDEIDYAALGRKGRPYTGVVDDPNFKSLLWFTEKGNPLFMVGGMVRRVVHEFDPLNTVWSEPIMGGGGFARCFDRLADWIYDYPTAMCLYNFRRNAAAVRPWSKRYMPTLAMGYWHYRIPPVSDKKRQICQSADELMVKSWMAVGSVPADELSFFAADMWEHGVVEPDAVSRYAAFMRERFAPACELLRNMPNEPAPVACLLPRAPGIAGGWRWGHYHYTHRFGELLAEAPVPFDVITEHGFTVENLSRYAYLVAPMLSVLTREQDEALTAAAKNGARLVGDRYCRFSPPGAIRLDAVAYDKPAVSTNLLDVPFGDWYRPLWPALRARLFACSDADGDGAYTFVKEYRGAKYVVVVNDTRRQGGAPQNELCKVEWYRPLGAPRRITTKIAARPGAAVYEFDGRGEPVCKGRSGGCSVALDYGPGEGRVFAVYPRRLKSIDVARRGDSLVVTVRDAAGEVAPGRQVVELEVRDAAGALHDESGRYVVEGSREIPLRIADDETPPSPDRPWRVTAWERTAGLRADTAL